jgi:hypothetical protein
MASKIKWYDYLIAFIYADFMTFFLFTALTTTNFVLSLLMGFTVGFLWKSWESFYCKMRYEYEKDNN